MSSDVDGACNGTQPTRQCGPMTILERATRCPCEDSPRPEAPAVTPRLVSQLKET